MDIHATLPTVRTKYLHPRGHDLQLLSVTRTGRWWWPTYVAQAAQQSLMLATVAFEDLAKLLDGWNVLRRDYDVTITIPFAQFESAREIVQYEITWSDTNKSSVRLDFLDWWKQKPGCVADVIRQELPGKPGADELPGADPEYCYVIVPASSRGPWVRWTHSQDAVSVRFTGNDGKLIADGIMRLRVYLDSRFMPQETST